MKLEIRIEIMRVFVCDDMGQQEEERARGLYSLMRRLGRCLGRCSEEVQELGYF